MVHDGPRSSDPIPAVKACVKTSPRPPRTGAARGRTGAFLLVDEELLLRQMCRLFTPSTHWHVVGA